MVKLRHGKENTVFLLNSRFGRKIENECEENMCINPGLNKKKIFRLNWMVSEKIRKSLRGHF